jgi:hypothetical protein
MKQYASEPLAVEIEELEVKSVLEAMPGGMETVLPLP